MASLIWNNELNPTVDLMNIHFEKINECIQYITDDIADAKGNCERTRELIHQLEQLCRLHFTYEEQLLDGVNYPAIDDQKQRHELFLKTFETLRLASGQCHSPVFLRDFSRVRLDFVANMNSDTMQLCDYIIACYR